MKMAENSIGTGYGSRKERKEQHKRFRGRITRELIQQGIEEYKNQRSEQNE
jgi:hypothetical protein